MLKFLEEIIKTISNRTYQIKNAIEFMKFQAGFNWLTEYFCSFFMEINSYNLD